MNFRSVCLLFVIGMTAVAARAQDLSQMPAPEKEHKWLEQFVGEWSTASKAELGPGIPPMECEGSLNSRMIGGFWVLNEMKGNMAGTQMTGIQTIGYDSEKKKYVGTWVDSMVNYMWKYEGTVDSTGKILTLEADGPNFLSDGKMTKFQDIYEFKSADEIAISSTMQGEDGKWITFMTGTATRQKKDK